MSHYKGMFTHEMAPIQMDTRICKDSNRGTKKWSTHEPNLYDITLILYDGKTVAIDHIHSYFGMRKISI
ncbi:hypothetical protein ACYSNO_11815 [Enterococcus sp. LJL98]